MLRSRRYIFQPTSSTLSERLVTPLFRLIEKLLLLCDGIVWAVREFLWKSFHLITSVCLFLYNFFVVYYYFDHCRRNKVLLLFYVMNRKKSGYSLSKMGFLSIAFNRFNIFFFIFFNEYHKK